MLFPLELDPSPFPSLSSLEILIFLIGFYCSEDESNFLVLVSSRSGLGDCAEDSVSQEDSEESESKGLSLRSRLLLIIKSIRRSFRLPRRAFLSSGDISGPRNSNSCSDSDSNSKELYWVCCGCCCCWVCCGCWVCWVCCDCSELLSVASDISVSSKEVLFLSPELELL